jgi:hypothetical protein
LDSDVIILSIPDAAFQIPDILGSERRGSSQYPKGSSVIEFFVHDRGGSNLKIAKITHKIKAMPTGSKDFYIKVGKQRMKVRTVLV